MEAELSLAYQSSTEKKIQQTAKKYHISIAMCPWQCNGFFFHLYLYNK